MRFIWTTRSQHSEANNLGGLRMSRPHLVSWRLRITIHLLRLWLPLKPLKQQELSPIPMKCLVFGDGLLFMAFPEAGAFQVQRLGCLPILFQS
ncbi:hypothetical protein CCHR01_16727 [Colletotrichum chrysophilum]|uniref:Uncharacterized protein n=1 Tax=Colletotrichum chrysophilum TaxID=1836956 RepID=A0AAD9A5U1_9PEZI|nr:hypothetical protein CCHR01_16727 [Colletotrichum chrysophilum]